MNSKYLEVTEILNYDSVMIKELVEKQNWSSLNDLQKVQEIYNFVRNNIKFGYNVSDEISASEVLADGYGQCNTKSSLLMALLRSVGIPNRIHGFTIDKSLQKGAITGFWYRLAPKNILHSWVEVYLDDQWYFLEGVILDDLYLKSLQDKFKEKGSTFCGYGVYTSDFLNPQIEFDKNHTFIQEKGINQDFGIFDNPDLFYNRHQQKISFIKKFLYAKIVRHIMNRNVEMIRKSR